MSDMKEKKNPAEEIQQSEEQPVRYTQNRELSWLRFNDRVLAEAADETVPLLERFKFLSIFTSNLDEFFMIRVGSLFDLKMLKAGSIDKKSGMTPEQQLHSIYEAVGPLYEKREEIFREVKKQLVIDDVYQLTMKELQGSEKKYIKAYFENSMAPVLSPQIVDPHHPFPHLQNKMLYIGAILEYKSKEVFAMIPEPTALPDVIFLPGSDVRFIPTEEVLEAYMDSVFTTYTVKEKVILSVTRNADIKPPEENADLDRDFRAKMQEVLGQRRRLAPVRLELSRPISGGFRKYLCQKLELKESQIFVTAAPLKMSYAFGLADKLTPAKRKALTYSPFTPQQPKDVSKNEPMIRQLQKRDILLSYPFESMDPFLRLLKEAANDPSVVSIKITIYRLASKAKLVEYLCAAAENGKDVTALIELRARFDEQNNIDWSERLEDAGCKIIYGMDGYKVHSKICLITRRERGEVRYITQVGTGNYNEKTAAMYTDVSLMTASQEIGKDATEFFKNMAIGNLYGNYHHLLAAPVSLKSTALALMDREIAKGVEGRIHLKLNSLTDWEIIQKLRQASQAGVQIRMIVRGICCLLPGVPGETENIRVTSIVGRFLEHSRIYCFGTGAEERMYISSADFMTRNTENRVEVACPIYDEKVRAKLHHILDCCEYDNCKARVLQPNGVYLRKKASHSKMDSQAALMEEAEENAALIQEEKPEHFWNKIAKLFHK